jgi:hypothetical protein
MPSRNASRVALFLMLAAAAPGIASWAADEKPASLAGKVADSVTGEPIAKVNLLIHGNVDGTQFKRDAVTDDQGRFSLTALPPGRFELRATRNGFVKMSFSVQLQAGGDKDGFGIKLVRTGAISGRVVDADGQPMEFLHVRADGKAGGRTETDEQGRFRIGRLAPGTYRVLAESNEGPRSIREIRTDGTVETIDLSTYYPGSLTPKTAAALEVAPGSEVTGLEIRLLRLPLVCVSGTVSGFPKESGVQVRISGPDGSNAFIGYANRDGTFEVWGLPPGNYAFSARAVDRMGMPQGMAGEQVEVEVASTNIEHVDLRMAPR